MHNPDSIELDHLQEAAIAHGDAALAAYDAYTSALAEYDEAEDAGFDLTLHEEAVEDARRELDRLLRLVQ